MESSAAHPTELFGGLLSTEPSLPSTAKEIEHATSSVYDNTRVIPIVKVREPEVLWRFWNSIRVRRIAIDYFALKKTPKLYDAAKARGIHAAIGFQGEVTAFLVGRDRELDHLDVEQYCSDLEAIAFDSATTADDYTYVDDPANYRMQRILHSLTNARKVIRQVRGLGLIGTVKGTNRVEIEFSLDRLAAEGIRTMAFPCSEFMEAKRYRDPHCLSGYARTRD